MALRLMFGTRRCRSALAKFFPDLELVVHGGVNFAPYRACFVE
jgi:hypothetical protein